MFKESEIKEIEGEKNKTKNLVPFVHVKKKLKTIFPLHIGILEKCQNKKISGLQLNKSFQVLYFLKIQYVVKHPAVRRVKSKCKVAINGNLNNPS